MMDRTNDLFGDDDMRKTEHVLEALGRQGLLDAALSDEDIDLVLAFAPQAPVTAGFAQRALAAVHQAQQERERQNPALALGIALGRARVQAGLGLDQLSNGVGTPREILDQLERGRLSVARMLYALPPSAAAKLLDMIRLPVHVFIDGLLEFAGAGGKVPISVPKLAHRERQNEPAYQVADVAAYVAALEQIVAGHSPDATSGLSS